MEDGLTLEEALANARARAVEFDQMIRQAVSGSDSPVVGIEQPQQMQAFVQNHPLLQWDIVGLFDSYQAAGVYLPERLPGVTDRLIDLKLQLYFVSEVNMGVHNMLLSGKGFDLRNPLGQPRPHLAHLCLMQAWIGQMRVLWERLMTLIYFLEEGRDPGKNVRRKFFPRIAEWGGRWDILAEWQSFLAKYDEIYRTPEYHNRSSMRKELFGHTPTDPNSIIAPVTPVMGGGFWDVLTSNIKGVRSNIVALARNVDPVLGPGFPAFLAIPDAEPLEEPGQGAQP